MDVRLFICAQHCTWGGDGTDHKFGLHEPRHAPTTRLRCREAEGVSCTRTQRAAPLTDPALCTCVRPTPRREDASRSLDDKAAGPRKLRGTEALPRQACYRKELFFPSKPARALSLCILFFAFVARSLRLVFRRSCLSIIDLATVLTRLAHSLELFFFLRSCRLSACAPGEGTGRVRA